MTDENYEKVKQHYMNEGRDLGYEEDELYDYFLDCKCFTYVGKEEDIVGDYYVIAREGDNVIAETFNGYTYDEL